MKRRDLFHFEAPEDGGGEPKRPEWLPENFKTPEDLAASYKELQTTLHSRAEEQRARDAEIEQLRARAAEADQLQAWYDQQERERRGNPADRIREIIEEDPDRHAELVIGMAQRIEEQGRYIEELRQTRTQPDPAKNELTAHYVEQQMRAKHDDWDVYAAKIGEVVQGRPGLLGIAADTTPAQAVENVEAVYYMVKGQELETESGRAAAEAAEAARAARQAAQTMSGQSARPATQSDDEQYWDRVRAASNGGYGS